MSFRVGDRVRFNRESIHSVPLLLRPFCWLVNRLRVGVVVSVCDEHCAAGTMLVVWSTGGEFDGPRSLFVRVP